MAQITGRELLSAAFSEKEWRRVPSETVRKLETYIGGKFDELITANALLETKNYNAASSISQLQARQDELSKEFSSLLKKHDHANVTIAELEGQLTAAVGDVSRLQTTCNKLEVELGETRNAKNTLMDEKMELTHTVERRTAELERMQNELNSMSQQLNEAVSAKCEALSRINEVESLKINVEFREKHMEQERAMLKNQIKGLTDELDARTNELLMMRRDNSSKYVQLEIKYSNKVKELANAHQMNKQLEEINATSVKKTEELIEKLASEKENYIKTLEAYQHEVEAQKKVAELYKKVSEEQTKHSEELAAAANELREKLDNALEKYGDLETKYKEQSLSHEEILNKKAECIDMLRKELDTANALIANRPHDHSDSDSLPKLKTGMSFTEVYNEFVKASEGLALEKVENQRLNSYIQIIMRELEEKGPLIAKKQEHYEKMLETLEEMTKQLEYLSGENQQLRESNSDLKRVEGSLSRENKRLKSEITDLSKQVCHLLREVELIRSGNLSMANSSDQDLSDSTCSADIISKRLVTFSDIAELQSANARLLALVRELSSKQEEAEAMGPEMIVALKQKLEATREQHALLLEEQEKQNSMVKMLIEQRDTYKNLYQQFAKGNMDITMEEEITDKRDEVKSSSSNEEDFKQLQQTLEKTKKELVVVKEEFETYKVEKAANEKIILEQSEKMRAELQEMMRQNTKLSAKCETDVEMIKVQKNNSEISKKQLECLEERLKIYSETIVKHEAAQTYLKEQLFEAQTKYNKIECQYAGLQKEFMLLQESESRLKGERDYLSKEQQLHSTLMANVELIKATLERNDAESKIRLEDIVKESQRECAALRRRLQEEQDNFRNVSDNLTKQAESAQSRLKEEQRIAETLRDELNSARDALTKKSQQLEELCKKLKNPILNELEISVERRRIIELEQMLVDAQAEVESLKQKLKINKESADQHRNIAEAAEGQLIDVNRQFNSVKEQLERQINEKNAKIEELEEKCAELQGELSLYSEGQANLQTNLHGRLGKFEIQNRVVSDELAETKQLLSAAQEEIRTLQENINIAESKYIEQMKSRSEDLQNMKGIKEERTKLLDEINEVKRQRDCAQQILDESKSSWFNQEDLYKKTKADMEAQIEELNRHNTTLHEHLQNLNEQMTVLHAQLSDPNKSLGESSFNKSFIEEDVKNGDQLVKIIKFLRHEKDLAVNKCQIMEAEHSRILAEQENLRRQYEEAKKGLEEERQNSEAAVLTAACQSEVLRKVETMNALTDSNRALRAERDSLMNELGELKLRTCNLEEQISPLQEKNKELQKKAEAIQTENITLRSEATRWRQRANMLIEKSNRTSPEDWKKLQNERETLAKQLTIDRANLVKLGEEVNSLKAEKLKNEEQIKLLNAKVNQQQEEALKLNNELQELRTEIATLTQDLDKSKNSVIRLTEDNRLLTEDVASKDVIITDVKTNLAQIRKIAKKYKIQAEEQLKEIESLKQQLQSNSQEGQLTDERREEILQEGRNQLEERMSQMQQSHNDLVNQLKQQASTSAEENEKCRRELDSLKEKDERFNRLFRSAKDRIVSLTEENASLKSQLANNSTGESSQGTSTAASDNSALDRCLKEKEELISEAQAERERLQKEIEALTQKVNQLQRQLGHQHGAKPSTSAGEKEKSSTEPPTANIKPMAGHATNQTQSVPIQPWRSGGEPPLASIRPMSMQVPTVAVLPTSQSASTVMVPPQQQVHTTGNSSIEALSSSPTSSHTDYVPATSSANVLGPRQAAVPPTQSNQDTEDDENGQQQGMQQQQVVAMVLPRVETPSPAQEQGTSSSGSSNTVTTTQAGHKRPREADTDSQEDVVKNSQQQSKRTRVVQGVSSGTEGSVSESGLEVEYQVPTSSQRDHEEDAVIVVESDEEGPDEGDGEDYSMPYEDQDQDEEGGNEVEVIDDSSEVPNQSERNESDIRQDRDEEEDNEAPEEGVEEETLPEATSSGTNVSTSVASTIPSYSRTRQVPPLSRQLQGHLLLPHGVEEVGDDGIVPSTPTLAPLRRCDGFGEAVSSPHVPSGRFTFMESNTTGQGSNDVLPEQTLESSNADDNSTGRSVPNTPLQTSPHESGRSPAEDQSSQQGEVDVPAVVVSGVEDEAEAAEDDCMGPPAVAGTSETRHSQPSEEMQEGDDEVSSEGEKTASTEEGEEEGREAEASPSTNTRSRNVRVSTNVARRNQRNTQFRGVSRSGPTPIVWGQQQVGGQQMRQNQNFPDNAGRGRGNGSPNYATRSARRSRGRMSRGPFNTRF